MDTYTTGVMNHLLRNYNLGGDTELAIMLVLTYEEAINKGKRYFMIAYDVARQIAVLEGLKENELATPEVLAEPIA